MMPQSAIQQIEYTFIQSPQLSASLKKAKRDFDYCCEVLRDHLQSPTFLANKGLGNEVGFWMFCYNPALELEARDFVSRLKHESEAGALPCRIVERNLYDVFLNICESKRILDKIPQQEERRGLDGLTTLLKRSASVEAFTKAMAYDDCRLGDVVFITGVGEIYPVLRLHGLFESLQQSGTFRDIPVVAFYPGHYTGHSLSLFSKLPDGNYYRAFNLFNVERDIDAD